MRECDLLQLLIIWRHTLSIFNILCDYETMTVLFLTVIFPVGAVHPLHINSCDILLCVLSHTMRGSFESLWNKGFVYFLPSERDMADLCLRTAGMC